MKIGIIGLGVVGEANKSGFRKFNHKVYVHDIKKNTKIENLLKAEIIYICVPTPSNKNGSCNTNYVENVISQLTKKNYKGIIAIRSTVEPGFTSNMIRKFKNKRICTVPEFLRERFAKYDFIKNQKLCLVGTNNDKVYKVIVKSHKGLAKNFQKLTPTEAELVKYFNNVYAALKITFANNMYELATKLKSDYKKIKDSYLLMGRSKNFYLDVNENLRGYAGMCLPKDTKALIHIFKKRKINLKLIETVEKDNSKFKKTVFKGMRLN